MQFGPGLMFGGVRCGSVRQGYPRADGLLPVGGFPVGVGVGRHEGQVPYRVAEIVDQVVPVGPWVVGAGRLPCVAGGQPLDEDAQCAQGDVAAPELGDRVPWGVGGAERRLELLGVSVAFEEF